MTISTRRNFLGLLAGTTAAAVAMPPASSAMRRLENEIRSNHYTVFGAGQHADAVQIMKFFNDPEMVGILRRAGLKSATFEFPDFLQTPVDEFSANATKPRIENALISVINTVAPQWALTPEQRNQEVTELAHFIERTAPATKTIFGDRPKLCPSLVEWSMVQDRMNAEVRLMVQAGMPPAQAIERVERAEGPAFGKLNDKLMEERMSIPYNAAVLDRVDELSPHGYPRMILFGAYHVRPMETVLRQRGHKVASILLHASADAFRQSMAEDSKNTDVDYATLPSFLVDQKRFVTAAEVLGRHSRPQAKVSPGVH